MPLVIRDLTAGDLPSCAWWVSARDRAQLVKTLERAQRGEVDYLAACPPSGLPVALGGVDYTLTPGAGTLWQLAVHEALQSCGLGTLLIKAAEQRIRVRGRLACDRADQGGQAAVCAGARDHEWGLRPGRGHRVSPRRGFMTGAALESESGSVADDVRSGSAVSAAAISSGARLRGSRGLAESGCACA
jgi:GNAT superfamily N-acetyltransferase